MCVPSLQENVRLSLALALEMISDSLTMKVSVHAVIKLDKLHSLSLSLSLSDNLVGVDVFDSNVMEQNETKDGQFMGATIVSTGFHLLVY